jgi:arginine exporter protein ArgO
MLSGSIHTSQFFSIRIVLQYSSKIQITVQLKALNPKPYGDRVKWMGAMGGTHEQNKSCQTFQTKAIRNCVHMFDVVSFCIIISPRFQSVNRLKSCVPLRLEVACQVDSSSGYFY